MATRIQIRRDTAANWNTEDPVLAEGEFGFETDTNKLKCGDGLTSWLSLNYLTDITSGNFVLPDNSQVVCGDGDDLKIYHDGTHSYVLDNGTGNLYVRGSSQVAIGNTTGANGVVYNDGGAVQLYHNNNLKAATTSTGVSVTGNVVASGNATVTGSVSAGSAAITNTVTAAKVDVTTAEADTVDFGAWTITETSNILYFAYNGVNKMKLDSSGNITITGIMTESGTV
jgi:hypothetical protein